MTSEDLDIYISCGIDYGRILLVDDKDCFGDAVNRASKLGEDVRRSRRGAGNTGSHGEGSTSGKHQIPHDDPFHLWDQHHRPRDQVLIAFLEESYLQFK